jgi:hypothetical protein
MAGANRHGQRWFRGPTPMPQGGDPVAVRTSRPLNPAPQKAPAVQVIPIKDVDGWIRSLPAKNVTWKTVSDEARYLHTLDVGQAMTIAAMEVDQNYVWIFSDIEFYATSPRAEMCAPPKNLSAEALVGILRLELKFGGTSPLGASAHRLSPYTTPTQKTTATPTTSGWPWLETPVGVQRMPTFALYAQSTETVEVVAQVEALPRFPISRIGVNLHGFSVPAPLFDRAWSL